MVTLFQCLIVKEQKTHRAPTSLGAPSDVYLALFQPVKKKVNKSPESKIIDKSKLLDDLRFFVKSYGNKLILANHKIDILKSVVEEYLDSK